MNSCDFTGRISNDIQVKKTQNGKSVTNISLAVKRNRDTTDFIQIVLWGTSADYIGQYAKKGDLIGIYNGTLQSRKWEDKTYWEVHAFSAEILSHSEGNKSNGDNSTVLKQNRSQKAQDEPRGGWARIDDIGEDLPF